MAAWLVLFVVLYAVISGKIRYDLTAFGGLLLLGLLGLRSPATLFSGFSSPALFTIITVLVMSAGIVESGILLGLGQKIASKIHKPKNQILAVFFTTSFLSAFMNNVGAIGMILPTAKRMAKRAKVPQAAFGLPIIYAAILGGSFTLIGTASNLIVSTFRLNAFGEPFKMFDFAFHGLAMVFSGVLVLFLSKFCGLGLIGKRSTVNNTLETAAQDEPIPSVMVRSQRKNILVLSVLIPIIVLTAAGTLHPSIGFGMVIIVWLITGVFSYKSALSSIDYSLFLFLGSMFGISAILEETGSLNAVIDVISPFLFSLPPFLLILILLFVTALFANVVNNSVAAVIMSPLVLELAKAGAIALSPDALLMAVAAGANLGIVLPTHQATIVVMNSIDFPRKRFIKTGAAIALLAGSFAAWIIYTVWV